MLQQTLQTALQVAVAAGSLTLLTASATALSRTPLAPQDGATATASQADGAEKAKAWPEPRDEAALSKAVAKVRAARSEDMEAAGRTDIQVEGAAAAPLLLRAIAKERKVDARTRLCEALNLVTTKEHTRLLAEFLDHKSPDMRVYIMRRVAVLGDPGLRERAEALLADIEAKAADPRKAKKLHEDEADRAAILALSTGSPTGLDRCVAIAGSKTWPAWREPMRAAASQAKAAGTEVADGLRTVLAPSSKPTLADRAAALRLIAYAGHEEHARSVLPSLDDTANHIKVAAVNALRMIVDGDAPIDKLSSFDAIGRAKKWKGRL
jgi:hypothetical protein